MSDKPGQIPLAVSTMAVSTMAVSTMAVSTMAVSTMAVSTMASYVPSGYSSMRPVAVLLVPTAPAEHHSVNTQSGTCDPRFGCRLLLIRLTDRLTLILEYVFEATKFVSGHWQGSRAVE
jgi:hypothetical protein